MKKIYIMFTVIFIIFGFYLYILYFPKNYNITYELDNFTVQESYNKDNKMYKVIVNYNELYFPMIFSDKYNKNRKIVDNIVIFNNDKEVCLSIKIKNNISPICYEDNLLKDFRLLSEKTRINFKSLIQEYSNDILETYNNIQIYNYLNKKFYIWNYKGYDYLNKEENMSINLLEKDSYNNNLGYKTNRYIITPNYDEKYYFTNMFVIDNKNQETYNIDLKTEISYSSYYLGDLKDKIYFVDKKHKLQYKIDLKKEEVEIIGTEKKLGIIYDEKWKNISLNKLINNEYSFSKKINYNYKIINDNLYLIIEDNKILLSNNKIKEIIYINEDEVYYLESDTLYMYSPSTGEVKLIENKEWNFNYRNTIMIFD